MRTVLNSWMLGFELLNREYAFLWLRGSLNMAWRGSKILVLQWAAGALVVSLFLYAVIAFFVPVETSVPAFVIMPARMSFYTVLWVNYFILLSVILALRPSVQRKDPNYFVQYLYSKRLIGAIVPPFFFIFLVTKFLAGFLLLFFGALFSIFLSFFLLFYFDGDVGIKPLLLAIKRAVRMLLYNLPIVMFFSFLYTPFFCLAQLLKTGNYLGNRIMLYQALLLVADIFIIPFLVAPLVFLYVKSVNQNYELYFDQNPDVSQ